MNYIDKDMGLIPLKEFKKLDTDYIRIYPTEGLLYKNIRENKKIDKIEVTIYKTYWCKIPINFYVKTYNNYPVKENPSIIHFNWLNAYTFNTLLYNHPDKLLIEYIPSNRSDNMDTLGVDQSLIVVHGYKLNKNDKILRTYKIGLNGHIRRENTVDTSMIDYRDTTDEITVEALN